MTNRLPPRRPVPLSNPNTVAELRLFPVIGADGKLRIDSQSFERDDPAYRAYRKKVKAWAHVVDELERRITDPLVYPRARYPLPGLWKQCFNLYGRLWAEGILVGDYADRIIRVARLLAREEAASQRLSNRLRDA